MAEMNEMEKLKSEFQRAEDMFEKEIAQVFSPLRKELYTMSFASAKTSFDVFAARGGVAGEAGAQVQLIVAFQLVEELVQGRRAGERLLARELA